MPDRFRQHGSRAQHLSRCQALTLQPFPLRTNQPCVHGSWPAIIIPLNIQGDRSSLLICNKFMEISYWNTYFNVNYWNKILIGLKLYTGWLKTHAFYEETSLFTLCFQYLLHKLLFRLIIKSNDGYKHKNMRICFK